MLVFGEPNSLFIVTENTPVVNRFLKKITTFFSKNIFSGRLKGRSEEIPFDGAVKERCRRLAARLRERPHEFGDGRLQRHAARLQNAAARAQTSADGVFVESASLSLHLRGEHRRLSKRQKMCKTGAEGVVFVVGQPARAKGLDDEPVAVRVQIVEDLRAQPRDHLEHEHVLIERMIESGRACGFCVLDIIEGLSLAHDGDSGEIDARKGVVAARARLFGARAQNDVAVKDDAYAERPIVRREQKGVRKIGAGVRIARVGGALRAREHDGLIRALNEVGERRGGICHGVRAVRHDKAVVRRIAFLDDAGDLQPVYAVDVGAVQIEGLDGVHLADFTHFWDACKQLLGRERGRKSLRGLLGGDRASRCDHQYLLFHIIIVAVR